MKIDLLKDLSSTACLTWSGLQEALQKMEDYMNEEMALKDTLSRISHEMEGKIDNDSLQLMKDYFGTLALKTEDAG